MTCSDDVMDHHGDDFTCLRIMNILMMIIVIIIMVVMIMMMIMVFVVMTNKIFI